MKPRISYLFIIVSAALAFGLASLFHFVYEWLGGNLFAGLFFPVNESIFQHLKLTIYPLIIVWVLLFRFIDIPDTLNKFQIFTGILISTCITIYVVLSVHYILKAGFHLQSEIVNISSLLIGMLIGQFAASRTLVHYKTPRWLGIICGILLIFTGILFAYFTLCPANIPIMISPV